MSNLGEDLKKLRHEKKISLEDISNKTKINIKYFNEIESNNFDFLSRPYVTAFVREYAQILKIDVEEVLNRLKKEIFQEIEKKQTLQIPEQKPEEKKEKIFVDSGSSIKTDKPFKSYLFFFIFLIAGILIIKFIFGGNDDGNYSNLELNESTQSSRSDSLITPENSKIEDTEPVPAEKPLYSIIAEGIDTTWTMVITDTSQALEYILYPEDRREFRFQDSIWFRIGKSQGIRLLFNGEIYDNFGPDNTLVWDLLITKDGIERQALRYRSTTQIE